MVVQETLRVLHLIKSINGEPVLDDISFHVDRGEIVGIIGSNGSGKSTLLRTLAGLIAPNAGDVELHGHTVSLLSLGTGFIADLSGHDNIILNGLSMGFSKKEIMEKYDSIVEFSELGEAIDELSLALGRQHEDILAALERTRRAVDMLEYQVDDARWPLPKYREMLFFY